MLAVIHCGTRRASVASSGLQQQLRCFGNRVAEYHQDSPHGVIPESPLVTPSTAQWSMPLPLQRTLSSGSHDVGGLPPQDQEARRGSHPLPTSKRLYRPFQIKPHNGPNQLRSVHPIEGVWQEPVFPAAFPVPVLAFRHPSRTGNHGSVPRCARPGMQCRIGCRLSEPGRNQG